MRDKRIRYNELYPILMIILLAYEEATFEKKIKKEVRTIKSVTLEKIVNL